MPYSLRTDPRGAVSTWRSCARRQRTHFVLRRNVCTGCLAAFLLCREAQSSWDSRPKLPVNESHTLAYREPQGRPMDEEFH